MRTIADVLQSKFECRKCGKCCSCGGDMFLTMQDVHEIELYLDFSVEESDSIFDVHIIDGIPIYTLKATCPCFFMDKLDKTCTIHEVKPKACREYPFVLHSKGGCNLDAMLVCPESRDIISVHLKGLV